jgi:hypothetical protein
LPPPFCAHSIDAAPVADGRVAIYDEEIGAWFAVHIADATELLTRCDAGEISPYIPQGQEVHVDLLG